MSQRKRSASKTKAREKAPLIYLVDDQPILLDLAEMSLQNGNYILKKFRDPETALAAFKKARTKPVLLVTDYAMGKMNGLELIEKCKTLKPELKSVLISGTAGAEVVMGATVRVDSYMGKPYQPASLAELVRRVLEPAQ
jgi:DNA-binding NtrC family response regulator